MIDPLLLLYYFTSEIFFFHVFFFLVLVFFFMFKEIRLIFLVSWFSGIEHLYLLLVWQNFLSPLQHWMITLSGILGCHFFLLAPWMYHATPFWSIKFMLNDHNLWNLPLHTTMYVVLACCFWLAAFKMFSLVFDILITMYLSLDTFGFIFFRSVYPSSTWMSP